MPDTSKNPIRILKSIWKKDAAGVWSVHDMQEIDLRPRKDFDASYFKIENDIALMTQRPGPILKNLFATFGTTEFLVRQSIVPVVAWNQGDTEMKCIGTGFFISASGLLLTAAHVVRDPFDEGYSGVTELGTKSFQVDDSLHFGVMLPANPAMRGAPLPVPPAIRDAKWFICPFEWTINWGKHVTSPLFHQRDEFKLDLDIAVCKVKANDILGGSYQPLNIGPHSMKIGDRAVAIGYAEMRNIPMNGSGGPEPELVVSVGSVKQIYPDNVTEKQTTTPGPCFEFDAKIPGKMSGSPILVGSGILAKGVVSRSWEGENIASGCLIAPILNLPLINDTNLLQLMSSGNEGIAHFRLSGI